MLSQSHHLARTTAAATAARKSRGPAADSHAPRSSCCRRCRAAGRCLLDGGAAADVGCR